MTTRRKTVAKDYMLRVKMNDEEKAQIFDLAERSGLSVSSYVRAMIRELHDKGIRLSFVSGPKVTGRRKASA